MFVLKAKERLLKELEALSPHSIMKVYDLVLTLKEQDGTHPEKGTNRGHMRTRRALRSCTGSLSDDIVEGRSDRL